MLTNNILLLTIIFILYYYCIMLLPIMATPVLVALHIDSLNVILQRILEGIEVAHCLLHLLR